MHSQALLQAPEKLPLDLNIGQFEVHETQVQRLAGMPVLVNDMLKGEGRMDGAKLCPVPCLGGMFSGALQNRACVTVVTPMEIWSSYRCAVSQQKCSEALVWAKCISRCSVLLCKTGSQQACVNATTPMEICSS